MKWKSNRGNRFVTAPRRNPKYVRENKFEVRMFTIVIKNKIVYIPELVLLNSLEKNKNFYSCYLFPKKLIFQDIAIEKVKTTRKGIQKNVKICEKKTLSFKFFLDLSKKYLYCKN